jgi:hypothetical protein
LLNFGFGRGIAYAISLCGSLVYFNELCSPSIVELSSWIVGGGRVARRLDGEGAALGGRAGVSLGGLLDG